MNIGQAAVKAGLASKTIRFYEQIGLVTPAIRAENGYRTYAERDVHVLRYLQRARSLGFTVEECRKLLALYEDKNRASADSRFLYRTNASSSSSCSSSRCSNSH